MLWKLIIEEWNKWGAGWKIEKKGTSIKNFTVAFIHFFRLFSQFNIVLDSLLQTSSGILICCFNLFDGQK